MKLPFTLPGTFGYTGPLETLGDEPAPPAAGWWGAIRTRHVRRSLEFTRVPAVTGASAGPLSAYRAIRGDHP